MVFRLTLLSCGDKCNGFLWTRKLHQDLEWGSRLVSGGLWPRFFGVVESGYWLKRRGAVWGSIRDSDQVILIQGRGKRLEFRAERRLVAPLNKARGLPWCWAYQRPYHCLSSWVDYRLSYSWLKVFTATAIGLLGGSIVQSQNPMKEGNI